MADLLQQASSWLAGMRKSHLSHPVTYCRDAAAVQVQASIGSTVFQTDDGNGALINWESRDFLIAAGDLLLDVAEALPMAGDRIKEAIGSRTVVYEVMAPGKEPCWRYSDPFRQTLRIHTKQVDTE